MLPPGSVTIAWEPPKHPQGQPLPTKTVPEKSRFDIKTGIMSEIPATEREGLEEIAKLGEVRVGLETAKYVPNRIFYLVSPDESSTASTGGSGGNNGKAP
jgi:hypothetical protein